MFSQASVILFTGGGVYPSMYWGRHSPGQTPPEQTSLGRHPLPPSRHPLHLGKHPLDRHPLGKHPLTATAADGTHPTGMHSCYRPQRSCGQGNIFTPVCHSVHRGGMSEADPPGSRHPPLLGRRPPGRYTPQTGTPLGRYTPPFLKKNFF